ncbi:hypothetical protein BDQ12DRAFT_692547 [Crucibulum laeve]|uniref:Uncharacterized protein n=1 Tax=Crucibulum laeve TaxID=68775 RepID=A0A5C3LJI2_9AGAR|nr:hypothetical protein BDQ12DRAFT_692547 [Crucibulum laeve]
MDSRPPPPQGAPPSYAFVTRMYRRNLRPVVLMFAFLGGLWTLFSGIGFFRSAGVDKLNNAPHLSTFSIVLGALYMGVTAIEAFGLFAAATQKVPFIRIYAFLTALATLIVIVAGLMRTVIHFTLKNEILGACTNINDGSTIVYYGFWGPVFRDTLDREDAADWCKRSYDHDSWAEILAFLITSVLAAFFTAVAFSYYRQALDPTSVANASRAPANQARMNAYPSHYNPPYPGPNSGYGYNVPYSGQPYAGQPQFAPPPGPPPGNNDRFVPPYDANGKPPGYEGDGKAGYGGQDDKDDPFADHQGMSGERDVTSRPGPFGRDTFR